MTDREIEKLAKEVWDRIGDAYHWEEGYTRAHNFLHNALREAAGKDKLSPQDIRKGNG